jgi:hypothetical protein
LTLHLQGQCSALIHTGRASASPSRRMDFGIKRTQNLLLRMASTNKHPDGGQKLRQRKRESVIVK